MDTIAQIKKELEQIYIEFYRCLTEKDLTMLSALLDDSFLLVHMTGLQQDKQSFIHAIRNGTLIYYTTVHENTSVEIQGDRADFTGESRVAAAVFGGGKHTWRLRLNIRFINRAGQWKMGRTVASTY